MTCLINGWVSGWHVNPFLTLHDPFNIKYIFIHHMAYAIMHTRTVLSLLDLVLLLLFTIFVNSTYKTNYRLHQFTLYTKPPLTSGFRVQSFRSPYVSNWVSILFEYHCHVNYEYLTICIIVIWWLEILNAVICMMLFVLYHLKLSVCIVVAGCLCEMWIWMLMYCI